ncbi:uncharacterized protein [Bemisia tabaci]|uniref:uncharacterized protein isoform X1 n=2 Tax=Bemisia tabaci TaxID=7038 RepID=UPI003B28AE0E
MTSALGRFSLDLDEKVNLRDEDITLSVNTDGAQVFMSGRQSLYPLQCRINEMSPKDRFSVANMIICALWFGRGKINMTTYLTPFVLELQKLGKEGMQWYNKTSKSLKTSRVFLLNVILDAVAKAPVMNMIQFNGHYGCYMCYHEGDPLPLLRGQVRYGFKEVLKERSNESLQNDMCQAKSNPKESPVKGAFGPSPLMYAPYFDVCFGFSIDVMHCILLGVCKYLFCSLWTDQSSKVYFLNKADLEKIDRILLEFKTPSNISRDPRSVSMVSDWKANEWRNWLIYYGPICLEVTSLPKAHFKNFCLLSSLINKLLQKEIKRSDLPEIGESFKTFGRQYHELYGLTFETYNVHNTAHIKKSVIMSGPLWATAGFPYENGIGYITKLTSGPQDPPVQMSRRYTTFFSIPSFLSKHPPLHPTVKQYCHSLLPIQRLKKAETFGEVTVLGNQAFFHANTGDYELFNEYGDISDLRNVKKVIFEGQLFAPHFGQSKKDDSFVRLKNGQYGKIESLCSFSKIPNKVFALMKQVNIRRPQQHSATHIKTCDTYVFKNEKILVSVSDSFDVKCILMKCNDRSYITESYYNIDKD